MIYNTNSFGGVVVVKGTLNPTDVISNENLFTTENMVFHDGWYGENVLNSPTVHQVERVFGYGKKNIYDKIEQSFSFTAFSTKGEKFHKMKQLSNLISWSWERSDEDRFLWVCPRFDFKGKSKPNAETIISNKFYRVYIDKSFGIEDIGRVGGGEKVKVKCEVIDYVDSFKVEADKSLCYMVVDDGNGGSYRLCVNGDGQNLYRLMVIDVNYYENE